MQSHKKIEPVACQRPFPMHRASKRIIPCVMPMLRNTHDVEAQSVMHMPGDNTPLRYTYLHNTGRSYNPHTYKHSQSINTAHAFMKLRYVLRMHNKQGVESRQRCKANLPVHPHHSLQMRARSRSRKDPGVGVRSRTGRINNPRGNQSISASLISSHRQAP